MVFSSLQFVLFFLIINVLVQAVVPSVRAKNLVMLAFSLFFYTWAGLRYVLLLLLVVAISFFGALLIEKYAAHKKAYLAATVTLLLLILAIFKYTGFFLTNVQLLTGFFKVVPEIALPLGISFYTFQLLSYVTDVYRGEVEAQKNYGLLLLYAGLFHQCVAGPIVRYKDISKDITSRQVSLEEFSRGITRFSIGLAKKALLANYCATIADSLLATDTIFSISALGAWVGGLAYMLQIYLDFSAYSDMAIGMGLMCGFHYLENFNYPYIASSITEFWRRWHISLSSFFRDYVYIPLGGNRCSVPKHILNVFIVWALTGLWHGASWNFVLWGLYYFVFLILEKYVFAEHLRQQPKVLGHVFTLLIVFFGWVIFYFESLQDMADMFAGLFGANGAASYSDQLVFANNVYFLVFAALACTPLWVRLKKALASLATKNTLAYRADAALEVVFPVALLVLSLSALAGDTYNPFLYFNF